jgi:hypothetical protein
MVDVTQTGGTALDRIVDTIIPPQVVGFLNTPLYSSGLMHLNYWSFVHFFAGAIFYHIFGPKRFKQWIWINIIFEIAEFTLALGGHPLFVEEAVDIIWDVIFSLGGFLAMHRYRTGKFEIKRLLK